jgi:hypothetical protein
VARFKMLPISQTEADTKVRLVGANGFNLRGSDDYECGHCDAILLANFDPKPLTADVAFHCQKCGEFNLLPRPY